MRPRRALLFWSFGLLACGSSEATLSAESDRDADGVVDDEDLCPQTSAGQAVDGNGCARGQSASDAEQQGFSVFVLDPEGELPVTLRTRTSNVSARENGGFFLTGTVLVEVPGNQHVTLREAELDVTPDRAEGVGLQRLSGKVRLPFPSSGFLAGVKLSEPVDAAAGYHHGEELSSVDAPLNGAQRYLDFTYSTSFVASLPALTATASGAKQRKLVLDTSGPTFFLPAALEGFLGSVRDAGVGFSPSGALAFTPADTAGIEAHARDLTSQLWLGGSLDLSEQGLPLRIAHGTFIDLDPKQDGKTPFTNANAGFGFGAVSDFRLELASGQLTLLVPFTASTVVGQVRTADVAAYASGHIAAGDAWLPEGLAVEKVGELLAHAQVTSEPTDTSFVAEGAFSLDGAKLSAWSGLALDDVALNEAAMRADASGFALEGMADGAIAEAVSARSNLAVRAFFDGSADAWHVTFDGPLAVHAVELASSGHALLDASGMELSGDYETPLTKVAMNGALTAKGATMSGTTKVTFPIVSDEGETETVTDAQLCGTESVTDAARCGTTPAPNGALCGVDVVTDATRCGTVQSKDPALCPIKNGPNAAECGVHLATDAQQCGFTTYENDPVHCGTCGIFGGCTCTVTNTCEVPNICNYVEACPVPATCEVPKTCPVPATCDQPKTCEHTVVEPGFEYGTFQGEVVLTIDANGLSGTVSGKFCPPSGKCRNVEDGSVDTSGAPKVCVTVADLPKTCSAF